MKKKITRTAKEREATGAAIRQLEITAAMRRDPFGDEHRRKLDRIEDTARRQSRQIENL